MPDFFAGKNNKGGLEGPITISGNLYKMKQTQRALQGDWNSRWFALHGSKLKYFSSSKSSEPSKIIDLLDIESIRPFENNDHGTFSFMIKTPERSYLLRAESEGDMKRWVRCLSEQQELWKAKKDSSSKKQRTSPKHYRQSKEVPKSRRQQARERKRSAQQDGTSSYEESPSSKHITVSSSTKKARESRSAFGAKKHTTLDGQRRISHNGWTDSTSSSPYNMDDDDYDNDAISEF